METLHEKPLCGDCLSCGFDLVSLSEPDLILVGGILMFTHCNHQSSVGSSISTKCLKYPESYSQAVPLV